MKSTRKLRIEQLEPRRVLSVQLAGLATFDSAEQLEDFLIQDAETRYGDLFGTEVWSRHWGWTDEQDPPVAVPMGPAPADASHSQANVQVAGVDEADIVRTDGRYLYAQGDGEIVIVDTQADGDGLQIVSRVDIEGHSRAMYLTEDRLTVLSYVFPDHPQPMLRGPNQTVRRGSPDPAETADRRSPGAVLSGPLRWTSDAGMPPVRAESGILLSVYDVATPSDPQMVGQIEIEGDVIDSRLIDDTLYLVSGDSFYLPRPEIVCTDPGDPVPIDPQWREIPGAMRLDWVPNIQPIGGHCTYETREAYWDRLGDQLLDLALPNYTSFDSDGTVVHTGLLNAPTRTYRPLVENAGRLVSISAIDVSAVQPDVVTSTGAPVDWTNFIYMSPENLYFVNQAVRSFDSEAGPASRIYQFALHSPEGQIDLVAQGQVPGHVRDQFSMDEYDGSLRVVTRQGWRQDAESDLYVLQQVDDRLETVGSIEDLAPGERLYAVRFFQDRAFVVTFGPASGVWFDPLFTIDLSDPANPQVQGELEIPGFSNYLHLIDGDFLIGLGRDADQTNGRSLEPQISLYDVSDFDNPVLADRLSFGLENGSWSEAFSEHLAISYFPEYGVLAIPLNTWAPQIIAFGDGESSPLPNMPRNGLWVFQIDTEAKEIRHLGTVEHDSTIHRSLRIGDRLFSVSGDTIKVSDLLDPDQGLGMIYFGRPARDDYYRVKQDAEAEVLDVLKNDDFPSGVAPWTITAVSDPAAGAMVTINDDGTSLSYTPADGFSGTDTFTYTISDGSGATDQALVQVEVVQPDYAGRMARLAVADLAQRLQVAPRTIDVASIEQIDWSDGCLGLGGPDTMCTMAIVPGYRITLEHDVTQYVYHTDRGSTVRLGATYGVEPQVRIRLQAVDENGLPVSSVEAGQSFNVQILVDDLREEGEGVFAAYVDILYAGRRAKVDGEITYGDSYPNGLSGDTDRLGLVDEVGAFSSTVPLGSTEHLLASIPFTAKRGGPLSLVITPADEIGHDTLIFGSNELVRWSQVELVGTEIQVLGSWQNVEIPTDINDDGYTTPLDVVRCINELNARGSHPLDAVLEWNANAADGAFSFFDVNGDGTLTPQDALAIIEKVNTDGLMQETPPPVDRRLSEWVDWRSLQEEMQQNRWASLSGIGMSVPDMLDLSYEVFAQLGAREFADDLPDSWSPKGAGVVQTVLFSMGNAAHGAAAVDRVVSAASHLEQAIDSLDLQPLLPDLGPEVNLDRVRQGFRDRFFARISDPDFLGDALD